MTRWTLALLGCGVLGSTLFAAPLLAQNRTQAAGAEQDRTTATNQSGETMQHPFIGMWITADGRIRQELLPNGRYDEARGSRKSAYQGRYEIQGNHIEYWDDTGFTADGTFVSKDELHHGGMIFYREKS